MRRLNPHLKNAALAVVALAAWAALMAGMEYPERYWEDRIAEEYPKATPMKPASVGDAPTTLKDLFASLDPQPGADDARPD